MSLAAPSAAAGTVETAATALTLIREGGYSSEYIANADSYRLKLEVFHQNERSGMERHLVKVTQSFHAVGSTPGYELVSYVITRFPPGKHEDALKVFMALRGIVTEAEATKVLGWQS
jgi:hypothetical protein